MSEGDKKRQKPMPSDYSDEEAARRRDEVVRRMVNTPPQPRKAKAHPRQGKKMSTGAGQKKGRDPGKT